MLPSGSIGLPTPIPFPLARADKNGRSFYRGLFDLSTRKVYRAPVHCCAGRWALTPPFHYHPDGDRQGYLIFCGTFCHPVVVNRMPMLFTWYDARCCPDFPP